jgi:hypothetical protein
VQNGNFCGGSVALALKAIKTATYNSSSAAVAKLTQKKPDLCNKSGFFGQLCRTKTKGW